MLDELRFTKLAWAHFSAVISRGPATSIQIAWSGCPPVLAVDLPERDGSGYQSIADLRRRAVTAVDPFVIIGERLLPKNSPYTGRSPAIGNLFYPGPLPLRGFRQIRQMGHNLFSIWWLVITKAGFILG